VFADDCRLFPIPGVSQALCGESYVAAGAQVDRLLKDVLVMCASIKIARLHAIITHTLSQLPPALSQVCIHFSFRVVVFFFLFHFNGLFC
jgi:hypothetical protein